MANIANDFPDPIPDLQRLPTTAFEPMVGATVTTPAGPAFVVKQLGTILFGIYERDLRPTKLSSGNRGGNAAV